ncbi:ABC transporter ATP-binding protein [Aeromicrobium camelliae]|uniref:ABC transporter ATP-binding protein n=1 Tax=Aeromicrobium camelliae TaxID=1538144 RepID=A0A3N6WJH9_9ACTN|nr:ABC transporter ATP-binding protein [Aeromicrobium camelliae]RQN07726.1 ABC transporter ATP-binding protein [Aeromicrobium camelliae]
MTEAPRLQMTGIVKTFGPVRALNSVDFEVAPREVHGLLGGNGAGKTTLMNVLYGLYRADAGTIELDGAPVTVASPGDAIAARIGMVHQTFLQIEPYTVLENIVLGTKAARGERFDGPKARAEITELSERFGLEVDLDAVVEDLPVGVRQRVEILKALYRRSRVLILDEPTTNLAPQEVDALFASIRAMVDEDLSVILITHKIRETLGVCDRMTVMREGQRVATVTRAEATAESLAATMIGETPVTDPTDGEEVAAAVVATGLASADEVAAADAGAVSTAPVAVRVTGLRVDNDQRVEQLHGLDLELREGEVLGIAGVSGNGQVELAEAVSGVRPITGGSVRLGDRELAGAATSAWLGAGVVYVPEDRHRDGILPTSSITENLLLGSQRSTRVKSRGLIDWKAARQRAVDTISDFSIRANGPGALAGDLSGGNIQRVILARAFAHHPRFLVLHNPTRGLDLKSTEFVYEQVDAATREGACVLLLSEDLDEVITLSDRVAALYSGRLIGEWTRGQTDHYAIGRAMIGLEAQDV